MPQKMPGVTLDLNSKPDWAAHSRGALQDIPAADRCSLGTREEGATPCLPTDSRDSTETQGHLSRLPAARVAAGVAGVPSPWLRLWQACRRNTPATPRHRRRVGLGAPGARQGHTTRKDTGPEHSGAQGSCTPTGPRWASPTELQLPLCREPARACDQALATL